MTSLTNKQKQTFACMKAIGYGLRETSTLKKAVEIGREGHNPRLYITDDGVVFQRRADK